MVVTPLLRPRDSDALRAELRHIAAAGATPVVFGGEVHGDALLLSEFFGTRTGLLRGLIVRSNSGLGGAAMVEGRPLSVNDYRNASSITHDYDTPVLSEGLRSIVAVPVLVDGRPRAILYGAHRSGDPIGDRTADLMLESARRLRLEIVVRDEVDRRLRLQHSRQPTPVAGQPNTELIREVHAQLRSCAANPAGADGEQLRELADKLAEALGGGHPDPAESGASLSARELDVLAQVALGCTNHEIAQRLCLKTETVKSYLRNATAKLGSSTRHEAVSKARRAGLLP